MIKNTLTKQIDDMLWKSEDAPRNYIGASIIGSDCWRQIWYEYNGYKGEPIPPKVRRTFQIGHALEKLVLDWLADSGINVDQEQCSLESENVPELKGHIDAAIILRDMSGAYLLEVKTAKDSSYKIFEKKGLREWNPQYYSQIQTYMGMRGVKKAYIIVLNKDTSELCDEYVEFNKEEYEMMEEKARMIVASKSPPPRVNNSPAWYKCKMCKFNKECHK